MDSHATVTRRGALAALGLGPLAPLAACSGGDDASSTLPPPSSSVPPSSTSSPPSTTSSSTSSGPATAVTLTLASPEDMQRRWAAYAAVRRSTGADGGRGSQAYDGDWYYETDRGHWAYLLRYKDGRAVMVGSSASIDRDEKAEDAARAAMLAGGETWWGSALEDLPPNSAVGFLCAWDKKTWQQTAGVPGRGGITGLDLVPNDRAATAEALVLFGTAGDESYAGRAKRAADAVLEAGPRVTAAQLEALGKDVVAADEGVTVAKGFAARGRH